MKIGLVCPYNIFRGGGVQECVLALKDELTKRGHQATIITPRPRDVTQDHIDGIILVGSATDIKSFHTTAQVSVSVDTDELDDMLHKHKFDVLHFHEPWVPIVSRQILGRSTSANIATFHAKLPETVMSKTIERVVTPYTKSILKSLNAFTAVSDAAAEYVKSLGQSEITIIPNGVDVEKYQAVEKKRKSNNNLYIDRLERRKGVKYLLEAFGLLATKKPGANLVIAGDGPDRSKLEQFCRDNHISNVTFEGYVDERRKLELLGQAMVLCSPALYGESFGIVLLEAMAAGTIVVAGNNPGYESVLKERGMLSIINPKDTIEFARRLTVFLEDEQLQTLWRAWAQDYVKQFSYARVADQYEKLYKKVLRDGKSRN